MTTHCILNMDLSLPSEYLKPVPGFCTSSYGPVNLSEALRNTGRDNYSLGLLQRHGEGIFFFHINFFAY